jgi:hypothetical protein
LCLFAETSDDDEANMMFNEETNGTYCTADLWRFGQRSRSVYLGLWLRSLFQKLLPHSLKQSGQSVWPHRAAVVAPLIDAVIE